MNRVVLLTKDAQPCSYYPTYGNKHWKTPNIDELSHKGTVFLHHYTAAPSTAMAFYSMFTGKYPYESTRKSYIPVSGDIDYKNTLFGLFERKTGLRCHVIWDEHFDYFALPYANCFGPETVLHSIHIAQKIGPHANGNIELKENNDVAQSTLKRLFDEIDASISQGCSLLWIHLPHVLLGRTCYGGDIDLVDQIVGFLRTRFDDNCIYISADHGNMNGQKNKMCYGFDVYESAIHIPLITPRIDTLNQVDFNTSNVDLIHIMIDNIIPRREFVVSDDAYYAQPHRKMAIIYNNYKYIFNKKTKTEELYDLNYDPNETVNLLDIHFFDRDRKVFYCLNQVYYYPFWIDAHKAYEKIKAEKNRIWKSESFIERQEERTKRFFRFLKQKTRLFKKTK